MTRRGAKPSDAVDPPGRLPLTLSLQFGDPTDRALVTRHRVMRWLRSALERPAEITVRVVDAEEGRALNRDFRAKDYPTNVLTFDYQREPTVVADLVLCGPVLRREADQQAVALVDHYAHLVVHGALHAQGYDHERAAGAAAMERRESAILRARGVADPNAR
jgi:probable rRNA maturation factor